MKKLAQQYFFKLNTIAMQAGKLLPYASFGSYNFHFLTNFKTFSTKLNNAKSEIQPSFFKKNLSLSSNKFNKLLLSNTLRKYQNFEYENLKNSFRAY